MTEELKGCPHCGASASGYAIEAHSHAMSIGDFRMPDHPGSYVIEGDCACGSGLIGETQEEVTARWNRRATPAPAQLEGAQEDEPVAQYQYRNRLRWNDNEGWCEWQECSKAHYEICLAHPLLDGFEREARALYAHPWRLAGAAAPVEGAAWQPIESVPQTREPLLLFNEKGRQQIETGWYAVNHLAQALDDGTPCEFTHWMPLPAAPEAPVQAAPNQESNS